MQKKKVQRIASIVIGLVLSILLIIVGVRIVQRRASQASLVENFSCNRISKTEFRCEFTANTNYQGKCIYGTASSGQLVFLSDTSLEGDVDGSKSQYSCLGGPLVADTEYMVALTTNEDNTVIVPASGGDAEAEEAGSSVEEVVIESTPAPTSTPEPTVEPTVVPETSTKKSVTKADAVSFFNDNPGSSLVDCIKNFPATEYGPSAHACVQANQEVNVSN